ncbi:UNVERIFIED_ORG: glycolate oxidase FAD binding subunit [Methylobacterium sp. SuP10 SLI 274]|uniref:glycolate oxidase subunit GlcE n=1 Tax=Methylorubrum extorquens TaxID=408 RepID=UPI00209F9A21|nr:glycolate oxidase subunit GlcE [Methylorubrum extorquens]MCP1557373.1 glycolate oxidase FAD binding subunit [Methylorubrum extorquens]MDF9790956.1 glycolate oxidase FAD binding subunit [Methylorubrum extorquens]MDF9862663.1 glycolate oxidase FAD binding subunit [Methylorubrum pseudosasae]MDH6636274.1 glycolate oxidase FAD binding subunit [Methylobacterium sp. SuP10 SLI 274]
MTSYAPASEQEAAAIVTQAAGRSEPLRLVGGGTKAALGRPPQDEATLAATGLTGITLYEPAEMVVAARAGTPLAEVEALLAGRGQMLPFEPMDHRPLLGSTGEPTFGAVAAANNSGPRRINAGAARDSLIGVRFVNGRGQPIKSGGRVMKNVTGLDLVKLMAGSWGTLGLLTEVTFKVLPVQEQVATLVLPGLSDAAAVEALATALGSPFELTGAAHWPAGIGGSEPRTLMRVEGFAKSVDYRLGELRRLLRRYGAAQVVEGEESTALWRAVRDATPLAEPRETAIWRISTAPTRGPAVTAAVAAERAARWFYDWGGGLIWLATDASDDAGAAVIRAAVKAAGSGHATLVRAPETLRAAVPVFEPLPEPLMRISAGIKAAHDPAGIFNPGRMYAGV